MKRILISTLAVLCAIGAYADDKQIVTSQKYLKDELDLKLDKLEGLGANKMLMYTTTSDTTHQIGTPRDIVNTLGTKTNGVYTDTTSNAVVERSAVKGGIDAKQDNITGKTEGYVAIYTSTPGELSEKGIYNGGTIKGSDTLVTAKTANDAIVNAVNSELTQVDATTGQPSNSGTLWRVSTGLTLLDIAAAASGGGSGSGSGGSSAPDLMTLIGVSEAGYGRTSNMYTGAEKDSYNMSNTIIANDPMAFAVDYGNGKGVIKGHGRCSETGVTTPWYSTQGYTFAADHFVNNLTNETDPDTGGHYCYCQLDSYTASGSNTSIALSTPWVFNGDLGDADSCASFCASDCEIYLWNTIPNYLAFRAAVFNSVQ